MTGQLYIISAPSGAGKTSLVKATIQNLSGITTSISHTTRPIRDGEAEGVDYYFVNANTFLSMRDAGDFLEFAEVFGNYYGTSLKRLKKLLNEGSDVILEIDWQGAQQVRKHFPDANSIFILPPSKQTLLERLRNRGQDSEEVISRRTLEAITEMSHYTEFDYLIINDNFDEALSQLQAIIISKRLKTSLQKTKQKALLDDLLE